MTKTTTEAPAETCHRDPREAEILRVAATWTAMHICPECPIGDDQHSAFMLRLICQPADVR